MLLYVPASGITCPMVDRSGNISDQAFVAIGENQSLGFDVSALSIGTVYDVWLAMNGGIPVIGVFAWTPSPLYNAGGYGDGYYGGNPSPPVMEVNFGGVLVNSAPVTLTLADGSTITSGLHQATFLGSIRISDDETVLRCNTSYGEAREWGIWNAHNQKKIVLKGGDMTPLAPGIQPGSNAAIDSENRYSPNWAPWGGNTNTHLKVFSGRQVPVEANYIHNTWLVETSGYWAIVEGAVGWDSITTPYGTWWERSLEGYTAAPITPPSSLSGACTLNAKFLQPFSIGLKKVYALVKTQAISPTSTVRNFQSIVAMWGQEIRMLLTAEWNG